MLTADELRLVAATIWVAGFVVLAVMFIVGYVLNRRP